MASEREAERQRRTNRRLRGAARRRRGPARAAVVAGLIAISERQGARNAARVADAERLGAEALNANRLDDALLLANAGVALDDSVTTRSNLLSTLLRSPAALGVLNVGGEPTASALSPDGGTLAVGERDGTVLLFDTETRELIGDHDAPGPVWSVDFDPQGDSLAIAGGEGAELFKGYLAILDAATARAAQLDIARPPPRRSRHRDCSTSRRRTTPRTGGAWSSPTPAATSTGRCRCSCAATTPAALAPLGKAVRVASRSVSVTPLMSPDGRLLVSSDRATYAIDAETLSLVRRYPVGWRAPRRSAPTAARSRSRTPTAAFACSISPRDGCGRWRPRGPGFRPGDRELQPRRPDPVDLGRERAPWSCGTCDGGSRSRRSPGTRARARARSSAPTAAPSTRWPTTRP